MECGDLSPLLKALTSQRTPNLVTSRISKEGSQLNENAARESN